MLKAMQSSHSAHLRGSFVGCFVLRVVNGRCKWWTGEWCAPAEVHAGHLTTYNGPPPGGGPLKGYVLLCCVGKRVCCGGQCTLRNGA
jgi:hypothetical protein